MKPIIFAPHPAPGEVTHICSLYADFKRGSVSLETINWAWLVGLPVYQPIESISDLVLLDAVFEDVEEIEPGSFTEALGGSIKDFVVSARCLDVEVHAALEILADKITDPIGFVRERAISAMLSQ